MTTLAIRPIDPELSKRKLQLCRGFAESGFCPYGSNCFFAHGPEELHQPTTKKKMCRNFHQLRYCRFGSRCNFIHVHESQPCENGKKTRSMLKMMEEYPDFLTEISFKRKFIDFCERR